MASTINSVFTLASMAGTDPLSIRIAPTLTIGTAGNVLITDGRTPNDIALLKPQDFLFMPVKAGTGLRINYDTASTTLDWFYWTRG